MIKAATSIVFLLMATANGWAGIISTTGDVAIISPPSSVVVGQRENNTQIALFEERQSVLLTTDLLVDVRSPGLYGPNMSLSNFPQDGSILAGTRVSSYYLHTDPIGAIGGNIFAGTVTFDSEILGLAFTSGQLGGTASVLGLSGVTYDTSPTGVHANIDQISLSNNRRTIGIIAIQGAGADNLRVITAIPEPASLMVLFLGVLLLLSRRWTPSHS